MKAVETISATDAKQQLDTGVALMLDVRTPEEVTAEAIENTIRLPLSQLTREALQEEGLSDLDKPLILQCRSGARSHTATEMLMSWGYSKVKNLEGGIIAWKEAGLPTK